MLTKIWKQLRSDWVRLLMAFVLACLIYVLRSDIFSTGIDSKEFDNIPIKLEYPNANIVNLDNREYNASVTFEGSTRRIKQLTVNQISISVSVNETHLHNGLIEITDKNIKCPLGIRVRSINTPRLTVNLEFVESKKVPVKASFDSLQKLSANYSVAKTVIFPQEVMISGPRSKIKNIKEVYTTPIPLDNSIQDSFKYDADITPISGVTTAPDKVNCDISIIQNFSKRTIKKIPISILFPSGMPPQMEFKLTPSEISVELSGPSRIIHFLTPKDFEVFVNAANCRKPGEYILNVRCIPHSDEVKITNITPIQINLYAKSVRN